MNQWSRKRGKTDSVFKALLMALSIWVFMVVVAPLVSVCVHSFTYVGADHRTILTIRWYVGLFQSVEPSAWWNTLYISGTVSIVAATLGFVAALNWWSTRRIYLLLASSFVISSLPAAAEAAALAYSCRLLGLHRSTWPLLVAAHAVWIIPFCTIIMLAAFSAISDSQVNAAFELARGKRSVVARKVILPIVGPAIASSVLIAFLLSLNEYVRTMYLSGPIDLLSRKINGMMTSGTDPTVYAITGLNIVLALAGLGTLATGIALSTRHGHSR